MRLTRIHLSRQRSVPAGRCLTNPLIQNTGWRSHRVTVVLFLHDGGAKSPCKRGSIPRLLQVAFSPMKVALFLREGGPKTPCKRPPPSGIYTSAPRPVSGVRVYQESPLEVISTRRNRWGVFYYRKNTTIGICLSKFYCIYKVLLIFHIVLLNSPTLSGQWFAKLFGSIVERQTPRKPSLANKLRDSLLTYRFHFFQLVFY